MCCHHYFPVKTISQTKHVGRRQMWAPHWNNWVSHKAAPKKKLAKVKLFLTSRAAARPTRSAVRLPRRFCDLFLTPNVQIWELNKAFHTSICPHLPAWQTFHLRWSSLLVVVVVTMDLSSCRYIMMEERSGVTWKLGVSSVPVWLPWLNTNPTATPNLLPSGIRYPVSVVTMGCGVSFQHIKERPGNLFMLRSGWIYQAMVCSRTFKSNLPARATTKFN